MNQSPVMYSDSNSPITPVVTFLRESQCSKYIRVLFVFVILLVVCFKIIFGHGEIRGKISKYLTPRRAQWPSSPTPPPH